MHHRLQLARPRKHDVPLDVLNHWLTGPRKHDVPLDVLND